MRASLGSVLLAACLGLVACKEEPGTQVMVVIDAAPDVRERITDVEVSIKSGEGSDVGTWTSRFEASVTPGSEPVPWPLEIALVPRDGDTRRNYVVVATARGTSGGILAQVRAISGYVEGELLSLPLVFDAACLERASLCDPTFTCRAGACIDPYVAPSSLLPFEPGSRPGDGLGGAGGTAGMLGTGGGGTDGDASIIPGGDAGECPDEALVCTPMVECGDECEGCPDDFVRLDDGACAPLLVGVRLSTGAITPALNFDDTSYELELPLLGDPLTITPALAAGVTLETSGVDASEPSSADQSFVVRNLPLGKSTLRITLRATDHESRTYTFVINRTGQQRSYLKARNTGAGDGFGHAVAIDGDTIVIGALLEDSNTADIDRENNLATDSGAAYVFQREGPSYGQLAYLKASEIEADAEFGTAVAIDGDTIAIGAPNEAGGGSVYVFRKNGAGVWSHEARLTNTKPQDSRRFGAALKLIGDRLAIGAPGDDEVETDCGAAYVYERSGATWTLFTTVGSLDPQLLGFFGSSVAFDDTRLVVGATGESIESFSSGATYVFERTTGGYEQRQRLVALEPGPLDYYGDSVQIEGDTIAVGAFGASGTAAGNGAVYVYRKGADGFALEQRIGASNPGQDAHLGIRLLLRGDLIITGAPDEDSGARGVNASIAVAGQAESGAGYMFVRDGTGWSQLAHIKANEPEVGDRYGFSVAADGDTLVFGSPNESSGATGVDGDPLDNDAEKSGAAYVIR